MSIKTEEELKRSQLLAAVEAAHGISASALGHVADEAIAGRLIGALADIAALKRANVHIELKAERRGRSGAYVNGLGAGLAPPMSPKNNTVSTPQMAKPPKQKDLAAIRGAEKLKEPTGPGNRIMSVAEVSSETGLSVSQIYRLAKQGKLTQSGKGKFLTSSVLRFLNQKRTTRKSTRSR